MTWKKPSLGFGSWPEPGPPVPRKTLHFIGFSEAHSPGKGGAAVISDRNEVATNGFVIATAPGDNRWGATIGLGAEFSFAPNWSAGVEYDHLFIGNYTTTFNNTTGGVFSTDRIRGDGDIFTVRINYRWAARSFPNIGEHRSLLI
jgi:hypothetical protein